MLSYPVKVLLVEDDEEDYLITRRLLSLITQTRFELDWVATYEHALEIIASCQHDVYLVDYQLGDHDGLELLQTAISKGCKAPIILLTGHADQDIDVAAMKAGVADYLVKGKIDPILLERSIRYAIERNRTLMALYESESRLEGVLRSLKDVVWSASVFPFEMLYLSPAVYTLYGRSVQEFFDNPNLWLEVIHPDDQAWVQKASQDFLVHGSKDLEYRIIQPDGSVHWIQDRAYLVCDTERKTTRMDGIATDITERKQVETARNEAIQQANLLLAAVSNLSTGVVISDPTLPNNPIIFANAGFTVNTGYTAAEVLGRNCRFLQGSETDPVTLAELKQCLQAQRPFQGTLLNYRKDGTPFWNELTINPVFSQQGELINFIGLQTDVTARKQAEVELERLRRQNELILNSAGEGIYGVDLEGRLTFINPAAARILAWEPEALQGQLISGLLHSSQLDETLLWKQLESNATGHNLEIHKVGEAVFWRKDGTSFLAEYISTPILEQQELIGTVITFQDITYRKKAEAALRESEERYAIAVQGAKDGLWDWNLKTNQVYFSPRWKSMLGWKDHEISNTLDEWFSRIHIDDFDWVKQELTAHLEDLTPHLECEYRMLHRDNSYRWVLCRGLAVRDGDGKVSRIAGSFTDITSRKQTEQQLLRAALYDTLTELPNRALLMDRLDRAIEYSHRHDDYLFAVMFLDLDRFKMVNDSLGHVIGNQLLVTIAKRLQSCVRTEDTVARLGGDEFVILLEGITSVNDATRVAERIREKLLEPVDVGGHEMFATASIGIALSSTGYTQPEDILRNADIAMYRAKSQGKSCYELFDSSMHIQAVILLQLETDLRHAIERQEFELYYQPIMRLKNNRLRGFEALIRWRHPERGLIPPAEFIPLAEETGLIIQIGKWAIWESCKQMRLWQQQFAFASPLTISVNLSLKQLAQVTLAEQIRTILTETYFPPQCLKLEITESSVMQDASYSIATLQQLKALGIQLAIDDFGTGYSSLSYLYQFPIDTLKIDRSFINAIDVEIEKLELVRTIATLAWNLDMDVVAEGIETQKQLMQLKAFNCEYGQGYLFSKPLNRLAVEQFMLKQLDFEQDIQLPERA